MPLSLVQETDSKINTQTLLKALPLNGQRSKVNYCMCSRPLENRPVNTSPKEWSSDSEESRDNEFGCHLLLRSSGERWFCDWCGVEFTKK